MADDAQTTNTAAGAGADPPASAASGASADAQRLQRLEALPTQELHDRAIHRAEKHMDVRFFWELLEAIPAAEAVAGDVGEADFDIVSARGQIKDALHSGDPGLAEALRPIFIDYLQKHPDA